MTKEDVLRALRSPFGPLGGEMFADLIERGVMDWIIIKAVIFDEFDLHPLEETK